MLLIHIVCSISGLGVAALGVLKPSKIQQNITTVLTVSALTTGTILVVQTGSPLASACLSGLSYLGVISVLLYISKKRLAKATNSDK